MPKKEYKVPCTWEVYGEYICEAESWDDAVEQAEKGPLPTDATYIDASFEINHDLIETLGDDLVCELGGVDG